MLARLLKLGLAGLAALTTLGAALVIVFILLQPEGSAWWIGGRLTVAAYVVAMGALTALYLRRAAPPMAVRHLLLLGGVGLTALGAAGAAWGFHRAEVTGDLEAWAILINLMMAGQGAATVWHLWTAAPPSVPAAA